MSQLNLFAPRPEFSEDAEEQPETLLIAGCDLRTAMYGESVDALLDTMFPEGWEKEAPVPPRKERVFDVDAATLEAAHKTYSADLIAGTTSGKTVSKVRGVFSFKAARGYAREAVPEIKLT